MLSPRRVVVLLAAVAVTAAACGGSGSAAAPAPAPAPAAGSAAARGSAAATATGSAPARTGPTGSLHWSSCRGRFQCASLQVPLDYARASPGARTIRLALIRSPATDPAHRLGSLVINPGGPGESAIGEFGFLVGQLSPALRSRFDVVGFDPRGVGSSTPVTCLSGPALDSFFALDLAPATAAGRAALVAGARTFARGCQQRSRYLLPYVGTANAARDLDRIRVALGERRLTYLGFSYGTYLGAEYAHLFPTKVRALVLDGALDPTLSPFASADSQSRGFESELTAFGQNCAATPACAWQPSGPRLADLRSLMAGLAAHPLPTGKSRALTEGEAFNGLGAALYSPQSWPSLDQALAAADQGDGGPLLALNDFYVERSAGGSYSNLIEAELAVNCRDAPWPSNPASYFAAAAAIAPAAPDFGPQNLLSSLPCAFWPVRAPGPTPAPSAPGSPPILVVATTGDPATPYAEGVALARELGVGRLLTRVGEGHTGYGASACVRRYADAYLISGTVPPVGARCNP